VRKYSHVYFVEVEALDGYAVARKGGGSMPRKSPYKIVLTAEEREYLKTICRRYTLAYRDVVRAKIALLAADGWSNKEIAGYLHMPREVVSRWRKRFFEEGLDGLHERPRPGRPAAFSPSSDSGDKSDSLRSS